MDFLRKVEHAVHRVLARLSLWQYMAVGIIGVALWDGSGYLTKGNSIAKSPGLIFLRESIPYGMRAHGLIMLLVAIAIVWVAHDRPVAARRVMIFTMCYAISISCAIVYGWYLSRNMPGGGITWSGPSKWFLVAWTAFGLSMNVDHIEKKSTTEKDNPALKVGE